MKQIFITIVAATTIAAPAFAGNGEQFMRAVIAPISTEGGCLQVGQEGVLVFDGAGFTRTDGRNYMTQSTWEAAHQTALALASITGHPNIKVFQVRDGNTVRFIGVAQGKECNL